MIQVSSGHRRLIGVGLTAYGLLGLAAASLVVVATLAVGPELRDAIAREANVMDLRKAANAGQFISLAAYGGRLLAAGLTSPTEVLRVLPMLGNS